MKRAPARHGDGESCKAIRLNRRERMVIEVEHSYPDLIVHSLLHFLASGRTVSGFRLANHFDKRPEDSNWNVVWPGDRQFDLRAAG